MNQKTDNFFEELKKAVNNDRLSLPSLPEVALKIRDYVESDKTTTEQIANALSQDVSMSARMIKVVNSPLYRAKYPVDDLKTAVTRLGAPMVRDLVMNLSIKQMYQTTSEVLRNKFRAVWVTSVDVAAICRMMSESMSGISKEQALLAGLIHNIGAIPIMKLAENEADLIDDIVALNAIIHELQGPVGELILKSWNFSDGLINVVTQCHNFHYTDDDASSLLDLVQVALLQGGFVTEKYVPDDLTLVPAFANLGMNSGLNILKIEGNDQCIEDARVTLSL